MDEQEMYWHICLSGQIHLFSNHQVLLFSLSLLLNTFYLVSWMVNSFVYIVNSIHVIHGSLHLDCGPPKELVKMMAIFSIRMFIDFVSE